MHLHDSCAIVRNRLLAVAIHQQKITAIRTKRSFNGALNSKTGVNIRDDLAFTLRLIGALTSVSLSSGYGYSTAHLLSEQ